MTPLTFFERPFQTVAKAPVPSTPALMISYSPTSVSEIILVGMVLLEICEHIFTIHTVVTNCEQLTYSHLIV